MRPRLGTDAANQLQNRATNLFGLVTSVVIVVSEPDVRLTAADRVNFALPGRGRPMGILDIRGARDSAPGDEKRVPCRRTGHRYPDKRGCVGFVLIDRTMVLT
jgi:hypothetical protein